AIGAARDARGARRVVGVDFSGSMLAHGRTKVHDAALADRVQLIRGDAMTLPVADAAVDAVTIAFGIRNVQRPEIACQELFRVLRNGGRVAILEFGTPHNPAFAPIYRWYSHNILPRIGRIVSRHAGAYTYLPESIGAFAYGGEFCKILRHAGFAYAEARPFMFGAVYLYTARKRL
ncbi:MAG TPA: ubiquinone/menaquinone biosynthesis methyltransferase, partial [Vicinamibacterales bacterium]